MIPSSNPPSVVLDASVCVAVSADEPVYGVLVTAALQDYSATGWTFYAPNVVVSEGLFGLCRKHTSGLLTDEQYSRAIAYFLALLSNIRSVEGGDIALAARAEELRSGFGCSRSADGLYIALTERLAIQGQAELLTLDRGMETQAAAAAPTVVVRLLTAP
jgi:predicted nucleic acid-binding protein